jgi:para-aminobenzoate synthetase component I
MNPKIEIEKLDSIPESSLYNKYAKTPYFFYLDSSDKNSKWSKFSFMGFEPMFILETKNGTTKKISQNKTESLPGCPFDILDKHIKEFSTDINLDFTPFWGGAVGYFSYNSINSSDKQNNKLPDIWFGFYNKIIVIDKTSNKKWLIKSTFPQDKTAKQNPIPKPQELHQNLSFQNIESNLDKKSYLNTIKKTKEYIRNGDIYQANISQRFSTKFQGNPIDLYQKLRKTSPAPYSAFINLHPNYIYSASPEEFIKITNNQIQTRPIKGTRARTNSKELNSKIKKELLESEKDNAELTMIVDLERNDLGQFCKYHSVQVTEKTNLEEYAQVFHLVSTIQGELQPNTSHIQALKKMFPGGSITGAPKIRAMQIINELETVPRSIYTGSIGYFGFNQNTNFNIAIRTMYSHTLNNKEGFNKKQSTPNTHQLYFHSGGGIVADSIPESEWQETLDKAKGLLDTLRT